MGKSDPAMPPGNEVLNAFEPASRARLNPHIERVDAKVGEILCEVGSIVDYAYFPDGAVLSLLTVLENGAAIETAIIGREGAFGVCLAMYDPASPRRRSSFTRCVVHLPGGLLRIPVNVLRELAQSSAHFRDLAGRYEEALRAQIQQSVACHALHSAQKKITRWLLEMHDRSGGDELPYTHEFLSRILGMNRKSVTLAMDALQKAGFISNSRGKILICNRSGLETAACECYAITKRLRRSFENASRCG